MSSFLANNTIVLDIVLFILCIGISVPYLLFINVIRNNEKLLRVKVNSFLVVNFFKIYACYIKFKRAKSEPIGPIFFLHIISVLVALVLGYYLQREGVIR